MQIRILPLLLFLCSFSSFTIYSQNVFLERDYWTKNPSIETIKKDVANGNSPTQLNNNGFDATVMAINAKASHEAINFLLSFKENDVNKITHDGRTYIFWAANTGSTELMEDLIKRGAKTDITDSHGYSIINFAAANGQKNTLVYDICLRNGTNLKKNIDHNGANALMLVAQHSDPGLITYFTSKGLSLTSIDAEGATVFDYAVKGGNIPFLQSLLKQNVKFTDAAMIKASQGSRGSSAKIETYKFLEELGIKPTVLGKENQTALHAIVTKDKQDEIIQYFLLKGVDVNHADKDGNTVFMNAAARNADINVIILLAEKTKEINKTNNAGATALGLAVRNNSPEVVSQLIQKGASVKMVDNKGDNMVAYLMQSYNPRKAADFDAKLKTLEQSGLDLTTPQKDGNTLLHLAVAQNELSLLERIGKFKVDVNAKNSDGLTALHKAAMTAKDDTILKYLIANGADKLETSEFGETAFDLASENEFLAKNKTTIDFLR